MQRAKNKKLIVVSAINLFEGGTLSILLDLLEELSLSKYRSFKIILFIHKIELIEKIEYASNIKFIELPKSRRNYLFRLYYEYIYFYQFSRKMSIYLWLSLHDITPNVKATKKAVYCHNASPFRKTNFNDLVLQPKLFFFSLFYKYLYQINIKSNDFVIVQQQWLRNAFKDFYNLSLRKIIVSTPNSNKLSWVTPDKLKIYDNLNRYRFFFPTLSRPFKNIEVITEAVKILNSKGISQFEVIITIDGSENKYSQNILQKYGNLLNISFTGRIDRAEVFNHYECIDCLIFPSKLESWGLPISEFKLFLKPMLVANLPYAKETVGSFDKVKFFNPDNPVELAGYMENLILNPDYFKFDQTTSTTYNQPFSNNWSELFEILLKSFN